MVVVLRKTNWRELALMPMRKRPKKPARVRTTIQCTSPEARPSCYNRRCVSLIPCVVKVSFCRLWRQHMVFLNQGVELGLTLFAFRVKG